MDDPRKLTVSFGTFACVIEGFDEPFALMQRVVSHFADLANRNPGLARYDELTDFEAVKALLEQDGAEVELAPVAGGVYVRKIAVPAELRDDADDMSGNAAASETSGTATAAPTAAAAVIAAAGAAHWSQKYTNADDADREAEAPHVPEAAPAAAAADDGTASEAPAEGARDEDIAAALSEAEAALDFADPDAWDEDAERVKAALDDEMDDGDLYAAMKTESADDDMPDWDLGTGDMDGALSDAEAAVSTLRDTDAPDDMPGTGDAGIADAGMSDHPDATEDEPVSLRLDEDDEPAMSLRLVDEDDAPVSLRLDQDDEADPVSLRLDDDEDEPVSLRLDDDDDEPVSLRLDEDADEPVSLRLDNIEETPVSLRRDPDEVPDEAPVSLRKDAAADDGSAADRPEDDPEEPGYTPLYRRKQPEPDATPAEDDTDDAIRRHLAAGDDDPAEAEKPAAAPLRLGPGLAAQDTTPGTGPLGSFIDRVAETDAPGTQAGPAKTQNPAQPAPTRASAGDTPAATDAPASEPETSLGGKLGLSKLKMPGLSWSRKGEDRGAADAPAEAQAPAEKPKSSLLKLASSAPAEDAPKAAEPEPQPAAKGLLRIIKGSDADAPKPDDAAEEAPAERPSATRPAPADDHPGTETARAEKPGTDPIADKLRASFADAPDPGPAESGFTLTAEEAESEDGLLTPKAFAYRVGAEDLTALMKAAAGWLTLHEGRPTFGRGDVMGFVRDVAGKDGFSAEARVRIFGKLVRTGDLVRVDQGEFMAAEALLDSYKDKVSDIAI